MKYVLKYAKLMAIVGFLAGSSLMMGCDAADLVGAESSQSDYCRGSDCPNGHNL